MSKTTQVMGQSTTMLQMFGLDQTANILLAAAKRQEAIDAATRKLVTECEAAVTALLDEGRDGTAQQLSKALAELKEASK